MARVYTQADPLSDVLDFLDANAKPCEEAMAWCRALGDITMGEFIDYIKDNDSFEASWVAYSVLRFQKLMNTTLVAGFNREMNRNQKTLAMVQRKIATGKKPVELEDG